MVWVLVGVGVLIAAFAVFSFRRKWIAPWREIEQLVDDVANARVPRSFLVDGNASAHRIGLALEDVLILQQALAERADEGEFNVRTILGAMRDGLAVVDVDGRIRLLNTALRRMFAMRGDGTGATLLEAVRDGAVSAMVEASLRDGESGQSTSNTPGGERGGRRDLAVTSLPMKNDAGETTGAVVLFQDVTQLQQLELVRREFVSNVSHELRTPLSIFRGYVETLLDEPELQSDERERILRVMEKHSERLNSLVEDLLSLARLEAPDPHLHFSEVRLPDFLRRIALDWQKKAAMKKLRLVVEVAENLLPIQADEARLEEIVYNLLDNAVKYSGEGGQIVIRGAAANDEAVEFSVSDEGTGIAAADLPRIFERFYRTDKARSRELGGTGLGLAIVKHIAQLHGGSVHAESQLGTGTTIRVLLPLSREL